MKKRFIVFVVAFLFILNLQDKAFAMQKEAAQSAKLANVYIVEREDNRVNILKKFLQSYNSPLAGNAETFVKQADENNLDWRLVASISGVESTFGKFLPYQSYNAWGWGIYGDNVIHFSSFDEGIATISKGLKDNYIDRGAQDVYQIGRFYAASPTWAGRVEYFMGKIDEFAVKNPTESLSISI